MTVVSCSVPERFVNPLFEVFDGGDFVLTSYRDIEDVETELRIYFPDPADASAAIAALESAAAIVGVSVGMCFSCLSYPHCATLVWG